MPVNSCKAPAHYTGKYRKYRISSNAINKLKKKKSLGEIRSLGKIPKVSMKPMLNPHRDNSYRDAIAVEIRELS